MRRIFVLGGGTVLLGAALAACGSSKSSRSGTGGGSGTAGVGATAGTAGASATGGGGALGISGAGGAPSNSEAGQSNADAAGASDLGAGGEGGEGGAPDCRAGDVGCDGLTPLSCQGGQLRRSAGDCTYVCDAAQGCTGNCVPGALKCGSATELDVCSRQGAYVKSADCDLQCGTVAGTAQCVECTSGDTLCPGGCTKPEDNDCPAETLSGCPNIFLGLGRYQSPQPKDVSNTSIGASATLKVGVTEILTVTIYNHGTDDSPTVQLEVLWGDPSDGCVNNLHPIGSKGLLGVPGATDAQTPGSTGANFGWTPDASALATNGGHVCLLARIFETTAPTRAGCVQQNNNSVTPETDPLSAVFDMQIVPAN